MSEARGPYAPVVRAGDWVICSGQLGVAGGVLVSGVDAQVRQALANMASLLATQGCALSDVVKTTVFLAHMADYQEMNGAYASVFGDLPPARSAVAVAGLPLGALVEIEAWAYAAQRKA